MKQTVLDEDPNDSSQSSDLQKSITILEKAQKILSVQKEKGQLMVKPIF